MPSAVIGLGSLDELADRAGPTSIRDNEPRAISLGFDANRFKTTHRNVDAVRSVHADQVYDRHHFKRSEWLSRAVLAYPGFGF